MPNSHRESISPRESSITVEVVQETIRSLIHDLPIALEKKIYMITTWLTLLLVLTACNAQTESLSAVDAFAHDQTTLQAMDRTFKESGLKYQGVEGNVSSYKARKPINLNQLQEALLAGQRCNYGCGNHITAIYPDGRCEVFIDTDLYTLDRTFPKNTRFLVLANNIESRDPSGLPGSTTSFMELWNLSQQQTGGGCEVAVPVAGPNF